MRNKTIEQLDALIMRVVNEERLSAGELRQLVYAVEDEQLWDSRRYGGIAREAVIEHRAHYAKEAEKLIAAAERENRGLLASEQRQCDAALAAVETIKPLEKLAEDRTSGRVPRSQGGNSDRANRRDGEITVLQREERCADVVRGSGAYPEIANPAEFSLGRIVRARVTGDRRMLTELEQRVMSEGTDSAGGFLVPDELGSTVIDRVRNAMRVIQAGALTVPMSSDTLNLARLATGATAGWKAENAAATASDMVFERVQLVSKTNVVLCKLSVELFEDMVPGGEQVIENEIANAIALELDRVALRGTGTGSEPKGIRNQTGVTVQSSGTNGATPTSYGFLVDAQASVWSANGAPTARLYSARTAKTLAKLADTTGQPLRAPDAVLSVPELVTNQIPDNLTIGTSTDCSEAYVGDFRALLVGLRTAFRLEASRQAADATNSAFGNLQVWIRAYIRADIALAHPALFTVVTGIRP